MDNSSTLSFDTLLKGVADIHSSIREKRLVKVVANQVLTLNELVKWDVKCAAWVSAHCELFLILEKCREAVQVESDAEIRDVFSKEAARVLLIANWVEEKLKGEGLDEKLLAPSMQKFLESVKKEEQSNFVGPRTNHSNSNTPRQSTSTSHQSNSAPPNSTPRPTSNKARPNEEVANDRFVQEMMQKAQFPGKDDLPKFDLIIGYEDVKRQLVDDYIEEDSRCRKTRGLLFGPPGTGKTTFIQALAAELGVPVFVIGKSDFGSSYLNETVLKLKALFDAAIIFSPCVLFFDEMDGMFPRREDLLAGAHKREEIDTWIKQADGIKAHNQVNLDRQVYLFGATNFPSLIDSAVWRRLQKYLYVPLPDKNTKKLMLLELVGLPLMQQALSDTDWETVMLHTLNFSCSDVCELAKDILGIPSKLIKRASHFRILHDKPRSIYHEGEVVLEINQWTPCSSEAPGAVAKSYKDFQAEDIIPPEIKACHIISMAMARPASLDVNDPKGSFASCRDFSKEGASINVEMSMEDLDMPFDSAKAYKQAKAKCMGTVDHLSTHVELAPAQVRDDIYEEIPDVPSQRKAKKNIFQRGAKGARRVVSEIGNVML